MEFLIGLSTGNAQIVSAVALTVTSALAAVFAARAVREARLTREQAARPELALDLVSVTNLYVEVGIANAGQGPALDADLTIRSVPREGREMVERHWRWPLIQPGQRFQFMPPPVDGKEAPDMEAWVAAYPLVSLHGTIRDQLGQTHNVATNLLDLPDLRARAKGAGLAGLRESPERRDSKTVANSAKEVSTSLGRVALALERIAPGGE